MSTKCNHRLSKTELLQKEGTFNPASGNVKDQKFRTSDFFDPHDIVQVRYEMLRRVSIDGLSVTEAASEYGISRPTYYLARENFAIKGIAGLVPDRPGPHGPHKLDSRLMEFLQAQLIPGEPVRARALVTLVQTEFGIEIHPRTIERALKKTKR
ncbi:MAG: helix-turn-helix domain-containing protein [Serratia sp. (in: enterobacteria)]|uniref:helix-turn-helix domain-containing protein n=1 Tax=Serratia sp. (in: enterobacteria) TaxID=616 RepID=UPI003F3E3584